MSYFRETLESIEKKEKAWNQQEWRIGRQTGGEQDEGRDFWCSKEGGSNENRNEGPRMNPMQAILVPPGHLNE